MRPARTVRRFADNMSHARGDEETAGEIRPERSRTQSAGIGRILRVRPIVRLAGHEGQTGDASRPRPTACPPEGAYMSLDAQVRIFVPRTRRHAGADERFRCGRARRRPQTKPSEKRPTFYILDAYSLIFQVFHAIPEMTGPAGQPTQAVFGIFRDLLNLVRGRKPDYLAAAFDGAGPVFRSDLYADYKANRGEMPADLSAADPGDPPRVRGVPGPRADGARHGGRRRDRHAGPPRRRAGPGRLHRHHRQGRTPVDRRSRPAAEPPQPQGDGRRRPREGLGHPARPGGRFPGPDGRCGRQRPGRAGHRRGVTPPTSSRSSARSTHCWPTSTTLKRSKKQQSLREHAETAAAAPGNW